MSNYTDLQFEIYKQMVDSSPNPIFSVNYDGYIQTWNPASGNLFKYDQEIIGKHFSILLIDSEEKDKIEQIIQQVFLMESFNGIEIHYLDSERNVYNTISRLYPLIIKDKVVGCVFANTNISGFKLQDEEIERNRAEFHTFFNCLTDAVIFSNVEQHVIMVNPAFEKLFGYTKEEALGKNTFYLYPDNESYKIQMERYKLSDQGGNRLHEILYRRKDGSCFYAETLGVPVKDLNGNIIGYIGIHRDITDRKNTEKAKYESVERFQKLMEFSPDVIILMDLEGKIVFANPNASKLFDIPLAQLTGKKQEDLFNLELAEKHKQNIMEVIKTRENYCNEETYTFPSGEIYMEIRLIPLVDENREVISVVAIIRDVTLRKKAEEEEMRLQNLESLGILAGGIAHDFNNILTSIMGQASLALLKNDHSDMKKYVSGILEAAKRSVGLTQQLLTFAKGGAPQKITVKISDIIKETTEFALSGSNIIAEYNFRDSIKIEVDVNQFSQVIQNMALNAKQAMPEGGKIEISTEDILDDEENPFVKIELKDQGIGIPKKNIDKIFDPYFTTKPTGTGLGLSVCHSIIKRHGGKIYVDSLPNKGARFQILLPGTYNSSIKEIKQTSKINKNLKILIMDDEEIIREIFQDMLSELGHETQVSKEGVEALRLFDESIRNNNPFDLVFLDLTIKGGLGGKEAVKEIRKIKPDAKVIVCSGYADTSFTDYTSAGFDRKLNKPFTLEEVNNIISALMN